MPEIIRAVAILALLIAALSPAPATAADTDVAAKLLRVQLVLVARQQGGAISPDTIDEVTHWMSTQIPEFSLKNLLKGNRQCILDFTSLPEYRKQVEQAVRNFPATAAGRLVKVDASKYVVKKADQSAGGNEGPDDDGKAATGARQDITPQIQATGKTADTLRIRATNIKLDVFLESLADSTGLSYVCAGDVGSLRVSIRVDSIRVEELLAALKAALNLSIKRVSGLYVFTLATVKNEG